MQQLQELAKACPLPLHGQLSMRRLQWPAVTTVACTSFWVQQYLSYLCNS